MGTGFAKRKKQAKLMQQQFSQMQEKFKDVEFTGSAGNGLVNITLNGEQEMVRVKINPECVDKEDIEGLESLVKAAYQDAYNKLQKETMQGIPGGAFPGMKGM